MANSHAQTLDQRGLDSLLCEVLETNPQPLTMACAFKLSFYAGLRVQEIAGLRWSKHVMDSEGKVRMHEYPVTLGAGDFLHDDNGDLVIETLPTLFIGDDISKYTGEREIPLHPSLVETLEAQYEKEPDSDWVIPSGKQGASGALKSRAHALRMRINRVYKALGLEQCTSHSGRRSFITRGFRRANAHGCSIRDVQALAGHKNIKTTQAYVDTSPAQARMVGGLWT